MSFSLSEDYLLRHAYTNVWCTPDQDKQAIFQLARITPDNGVWTNFTYQWRKIGLPVAKSRFHVYHIGEVHPSILGLMNKRGGWIPVPDAMQGENVNIQVYNGRGTVVPKCLCWYLVLGDNNLILAVRKSEQKDDLTGIDMETEPLFMRLYSNAYFNLPTSNVEPGIRVLSRRCNTTLKIVEAQTEIESWPKTGMITSYVNGKVVDKIDPVTAKPGDYVEAVFDASVKFAVEYVVTSLREFNSTLDNMRKYLLTHGLTTNTIDYMDDVDVFVTTYTTGTRWHGTYLHKNDSKTMRQVTHRDYSIAVPRVAGAAASNPHLAGKKLRLRMIVRNSGYNRKLVMENSRLFELYKLTAAQRLDAMLGVNAHVDVWKAANLEKSAYVAIMGAQQGAITKDLVQKAYGYNALSVLLGDTPKKTTVYNGQNIVFVPEGLRGLASIYEYDAAGVLLTYNSTTLDNTYTAKNNQTVMAEVVFGVAATTLDIQTTATGTIDPTLNYRFYSAPAVGGIKTGPWEDVTDTPSYLIQNDRFQWVSTANKLTRVVSNKKFLGYTTRIKANAGVFEFDLVHQTSLGLEKFDVALGQLDLFLNGRSLIENIDYIVKGSRVVIITKEYFVGDPGVTAQEVVVRFMGFAATDGTREMPDDIGFVNNRMLSVNNHYNIRDDKVLRIVMGGATKLRTDLKFAENGILSAISDASNGKPYAIRDIVVPMNRYLISDAGCKDHTYHMRADSIVIDKQVSDYMSIKKPQGNPPAINAIPARYKVYSPFLARIISDLNSGILWSDKFTEHFGDEYLKTVTAPYEYLLAFDPIATDNDVDDRYVVIHPHLQSTYVSMEMYQWRVVQRIVKLYAANVDLSSTMNVIQF